MSNTLESPLQGELQASRFDAPIVFGTNDEHIAEVRNKVSGLTIAGLDDKHGYEAVTKGIAYVRTLRVGVEKTRKELKADALEFGRKVDAEAKRLTEALEAIEKPLKDQKDHIDFEKERIKKEAEEAKRKKLEARLELLASVNAKINPLYVAEWSDDQFLEQFGLAQQAFEEAQRLEREEAERVARVEAERKAAEEAERQAREEALRLEREKLEAERAAMEAERLKEQARMEAEREAMRLERERLEAERLERDRIEAEERAKVREAQRIEQERIEAERAAIEAEKARIAREQAAKERADREEAERIERERENAERLAAEAARLEALKPDKEKLKSVAAQLYAIHYPKMDTQDGYECIEAISTKIRALARYAEECLEEDYIGF